MNNKIVLKKLLKYIIPFKFYIAAALVCAIINIGMVLYAPILTGNGIDLIIGKGNVDFSEILNILIKLIAVIIIAALFQWLMFLCTNIITYKTIKSLRFSLFKKINNVPLKFIDQNSHGDIISRIINDIDFISDGLLQGFSQLFTGAVTIIGTIIFMISISPIIAVTVILLTPLSLFVAAFIAKNTHKMFTEQSKTQGELSGYINETITNLKTVKIFGYEKHAEETFFKINAKLYESGVKAQFYSSLTNPSTRFVNSIVYTAVGVFGAITAINGLMSIGQITSFLIYANQYTKPFNEVTAVITQLQTAMASAARVFSVLEQESESLDNPKILEKSDGSIHAEKVYFSYTPDIKLIENFNLAVKPGSRIAIVGPTGCGKTTVINLLMRFYDVDSGEIKVNDINIKDVTRMSLREKYGMVLQETWLFTGTIRENIAYGKPTAAMEEIIAAAKAAYAHSFIKRLPEGYETKISEDGGNLSQGQKQLLSIARIMLIKPPMLILDEATSSIDTMTEIRIQKAFKEMMKGRTSFIVAHRLSTVKDADIILVMNNGNVIEQGSHQELFENKNSFYYKLFYSQFALN
ncbi:MAG: transporter ATP-binding protein [Clostridia bacterium]|nr:transporter ATP-binding protein [Clostridia bacterium]